MKINCAICLELLIGSDDISSVSCGHVFHTKCLETWVTTNKHTCPTCRKTCPEKQIRRLYLSEAANFDGSQYGPDVNDLQNKVDSMNFNLRMIESEKKRLAETCDTLKAQNVGLREEYKALELRLQTARDDIFAANAKVKLLQCDKKKFDALKSELEQTKSTLQLYKTIEMAVKGSTEELAYKLHEMGDYSSTAKDMTVIIMALKKELKNRNVDETNLKKELMQKNRQLADLKASLEMKNREIKMLEDTNKSLDSDRKSLEEELEITKSKVLRLQEAIVSPSGDIKSSAINRLIFEHPPPINLTILDESPPPPQKPPTSAPKKKSMGDFFDISDDEDATSRSQPTKKSKLTTSSLTSGAFKDVSNNFKKPTSFVRTNSSGLTGLLGTMATSQSYKCEPRNPGKTEEMFFNGLGGHSKPDSFPQPLKKDFKLKPVPFSKKPKGVSRPKASFANCAEKNLATIDKFFNLDTP